MPFKPGDPRPAKAGRKSGSVNLRTQDLVDLLESLNYSPVAKLIEVGAKAEAAYEKASTSTDQLTRSTAHSYLRIAQSSASDLMPYLFPKRRAVEHTGAEGQPLFQSFGDLVKSIVDKKSDA